MSAQQRQHQIREQLLQRSGELEYDLRRNADERSRIIQEIIRTADAIQEIEADMSQIRE